ncbi:SRPBCC family protein [Micropruina sonneratiae]|uniref:SRPBCC family protein n=1 Tax=Micropruina sonneratiae TaxID=2986940 RepID=UPI0022271FBD|nr:SRPBCC domain-containing protein [Micropruina sp. KQZ13P-5]MCW3157795.1 SRPBCC domain-containing protein [Micropruina sp. KQZ13P-5]
MTDSTLTGDVLIATRRVAAPIERVWTAFTTPADLAAFWGGSHAHVPADCVRIELRVGGGFELVSLPRSDASPGTVLRFATTSSSHRAGWCSPRRPRVW